MIAIKNLTCEKDNFYLSALNLEVGKGEIYFLLNRLDQDNDSLFHILGGFQAAAQRGNFLRRRLPARRRASQK